MAYNSDTLALLINSTFKSKWDAAHPKTPLQNSGIAYEERMILFESIAEALLSHLSSEVAGSVVIDAHENSHTSSVSSSGGHVHGDGKHTHTPTVSTESLPHTVSIITNL